MTPLESTKLIKFKLLRKKNIFNTEYVLQSEVTKEFILCAEKKLTQTSYYHVSMIPNEYSKENG